MHLRRGPLVLITGGSVAVISFVISTFLLTENTYVIGPGDNLTLRQHFSNSSLQGVYSISIPYYEDQPNLKIVNARNQTVTDRNITAPFVSETFSSEGDDYFTLILTNPSTDKALEASVLFGDRASFASTEQVISSFMLSAGIITAIAGSVITILDRRRSSKMKQFGDTSDLV